MYYVGPDGYSEPFTSGQTENCEPIPLLAAPVGSLVARVASGQPFLVGSRYSFRTQQAGDLFFRINDDCLSDNDDGKITVKVGLIPAADVILPTPEQPGTQPTSYTYTVSADQSAWQDTGIPLTKGQRGTISYVYGVWSFNTRGGWRYYVGPAGYPYEYSSVLSGKCGSRPLPGAPFGALVARVGGTGPVFLVGMEASFQAGQPGDLLFRINDDCMGDDYGRITVNVNVMP